MNAPGADPWLAVAVGAAAGLAGAMLALPLLLRMRAPVRSQMSFAPPLIGGVLVGTLVGAATLARLGLVRAGVCALVGAWVALIVARVLALRFGIGREGAAHSACADVIALEQETQARLLAEVRARDRAEEARLVELRARAAADPTVVTALIAQLGAVTRDERCQAARDLGECGAREASDALRAAMATDDDVFVRAVAASALGKIGAVDALDALRAAREALTPKLAASYGYMYDSAIKALEPRATGPS